MWIIAGGMLRSASTLQYQLASAIVERLSLGKRVTWYSPEEHEAFFAETENVGFQVFKSHDLTPPIRNILRTGQGVGIYIYRDVRDVVSSLMEKEGRSYSGSEIGTTVEALLDSHRQWTAEDSVYVSRYESVLSDLRTEVVNLSRHIGVDISPQVVDEIANDYVLEKQMKRIDACHAAGKYVSVNASIKYDSHSLLHHNHLAGGEAGRYRNNLSSEQIGIIESIAGPWLADNGYM